MRDGYALVDQTLFPIWGSADPADLNGIRNITAGLSAAYLDVRLATADMWEDQDGNLPPVAVTADDSEGRRITDVIGVFLGVSARRWGYRCRPTLRSGAPCSGKPLTGR
ncbi:hypothetical protein [Komagataeibacter swingsii]|uniref:Uncharacterized protein n=1 Tax=Komagataeibacter swingsii TaxID=215220 RepID=A0A2V4RKH1_9PROT|nr:hypothetical protein [Komagataeibacter swingsii]PYD69504.1 hypothetical protein CFR76_09240 [Komagataeibacter swingsii]